MRVIRYAIFLACALPMAADTFTVTRTTVEGREMIQTTYQRGNNYRNEIVDSIGHKTVTIFAADPNASIYLDAQEKKYVAISHKPDLLISLAQMISRPPRPVPMRDSGKTVNVYYETVDTGERRECFGETARHIISRERRVAEPGACAQNDQAETDGWYIPFQTPSVASNSPTLHGAYTIGVQGLAFWRFRIGPNCQDRIIEHGKRFIQGIAVLETRGSIKREILERSSAPLDPSLFAVPSGYEKVDAIAGGPAAVNESQRLAEDWTFLQQAVESWFR